MWLLCFLFLCSTAISAAADSVIHIGSQKQLFIDKKFILSDSGIELKMNPPIKQGPAILGEKPWELGWIVGTSSVVEDAGVYKFWYVTTAPFTKMINKNEGFLCYAESKDGVHWQKPNLGVFEWHGSTANNIVLQSNFETGSVFIDPKAPPEQRYKLVATLSKWRAEFSKEGPNGSGMYIYTSPDGFRWKLDPTLLFPFHPDTLNQAFYDPRIGKYVVYMRIWNPLRKVGRLETEEVLQPWPYDKTVKPYFLWGKDHPPTPSREIATAFAYDEQDPVPSDHYTSAVVQYPWAADAYFMFPSAYLHYPDPPKGKFRNDGPVDIQMAVGRDGVKFQRVERAPYVELGLPGSKENGSLYMMVGMVRHGDEIYQYYGAFPFTHGAYPGIPEEQQVGIGALLRLSQRLDGFVSADAGMSGGSFVTPPLRFEGKQLALNLNASALGEVLVELRDEKGAPIKGFTFEECDPIHRNHLAYVVIWNQKSDVQSLASQPVRIAFKLRAVKMYAFQFMK